MHSMFYFKLECAFAVSACTASSLVHRYIILFTPLFSLFTYYQPLTCIEE